MANDENPNTSATPAAEPAKKAPREAKSEKGWLDSNGAAVDDIESATGISYKDLATGENFTYQIPGGEAGSVVTMFALFGATTRATNAASAARQKRDRDATYLQSDVEYIAEVFGETVTGVWAVAGEGVKAPVYDNEILATVICDLLAAEGKPQDHGKILAKLASDSKYRLGAIRNPKVKIAYITTTGKSATVDSLAID